MATCACGTSSSLMRMSDPTKHAWSVGTTMKRLPPARAPEAEVRDIVRTVAVHRRPLCVRDKFGVEIMSLDAAFSELRPPRTSAGL